MVGSANWSACSFFAFLQVPHQLHFIIAIKLSLPVITSEDAFPARVSCPMLRFETDLSVFCVLYGRLPLRH